VPDGDEDVLEAVALPHVVVDVARGDGADPQVLGQVGQGTVAAGVAVHQVVLKLDEVVVGAEPLQVAASGLLRLPIAALGGQRRHLAPAAAGEGDEAVRVLREHLWLDARPAALVVQVGVGEEAAEVGVAPLRLTEEGQVVAVGERDLGAGDGLEAPGAGALSELHRPVEAVVVGEGEGLVPHLPRPQHQLLDVRGALEEGEVRVTVELSVRQGSRRLEQKFLICQVRTDLELSNPLDSLTPPPC
jgi:hypothetical protein